MSADCPEPQTFGRTVRRHGGWRPGDPVGQRRFSRLFAEQPLRLESGQSLGPINLAWESWGELDATHSNAILLLHGFSGDSHAAGPAGAGHAESGWWERLIGPGRAIDTDRFCVICPNVLGGCQGSTGPASPAADGRPYGSRFPALSIRDMVAAERALADQLGIGSWYAVIGGSMGGMRALEWAIGSPQRVPRLLLMATAASCSPDNIAMHTCQIEAIRLDPHFCGGDYHDDSTGGPRQGLALARKLALQTYVSAAELERQLRAGAAATSQEQGPAVSGQAAGAIGIDAGAGHAPGLKPGLADGGLNRSSSCDAYGLGVVAADVVGVDAQTSTQGVGVGLAIAHGTAAGASTEPRADEADSESESPIVALLARQAEEFVQRFDANSYITLTRAMTQHDIGRGRGGMAAALALITAKVHVVSVSSDRLFPPGRQQELAAGIPGGASYTSLNSDLGHDGFLEELEQLRLILSKVLD